MTPYDTAKVMLWITLLNSISAGLTALRQMEPHGPNIDAALDHVKDEVDEATRWLEEIAITAGSRPT
jgi:hypothetical protein